MPSKAPHANKGATQKREARRKRKHNAHTYEREGIEGALQVKAKSPIKDLDMGPQMLPNQDIKSQMLRKRHFGAWS